MQYEILFLDKDNNELSTQQLQVFDFFGVMLDNWKSFTPKEIKFIDTYFEMSKEIDEEDLENMEYDFGEHPKFSIEEAEEFFNDLLPNSLFLYAQQNQVDFDDYKYDLEIVKDSIKVAKSKGATFGQFIFV